MATRWCLRFLIIEVSTLRQLFGLQSIRRTRNRLRVVSFLCCSRGQYTFDDITATDATAEASVIIPIYSSFDFDGEGKILFQQNFGDFTAAFNSLN